MSQEITEEKLEDLTECGSCGKLVFASELVEYEDDDDQVFVVCQDCWEEQLLDC